MDGFLENLYQEKDGKMENMKVWAHRGASGYMPENTMEAFEMAIRQKADGIELDVQMSKDGKLVIMHDETVNRVTDGKGMIKDFTLQQIKKLKVRTPHTKPGTYRVPTLEEVLELMRPTDLLVNIELKNSIFLYPGMEEEILKLVEKMGMEDQIFYSSFNHYSLMKLKMLAPHVPTGLLFNDGLVNVASYGKSLGVTALHPAVYHLLYPNFVKECQDAGLKMHVWTANEPEHIELVKSVKADAVITNYPDRAREIILQKK